MKYRARQQLAGGAHVLWTLAESTWQPAAPNGVALVTVLDAGCEYGRVAMRMRWQGGARIGLCIIPFDEIYFLENYKHRYFSSTIDITKNTY